MGLFNRRAPKVPALVPIPPIAELPPARMQASVRYLGTLTVPNDGGPGERVIGQSLSAKSSARLSLSSEALDVVRIAGSFWIRNEALRGARSADHFNGKPVRDLLLIRWAHEGLDWETGFRMEAARTVKAVAKEQRGRVAAGTAEPKVGEWVRTISKISRGNQ